jgi:hypothetical protein
MLSFLKEKTNDFFAKVLEEVETYQENLKMEALDHLDAWTQEQAALA